MSASFRSDSNDDDVDSSAHPLETMLKEVTLERDHLAAGTAIGSFVLRQVIERDEFSVLYLATASASGMEVTIEEYLPSALATRGEDGVLRPRSDAQAELLAAGLQAFLQESDQLGRLSDPALMRIGPVWQTRGTAFRLRLDLPGATLAALRPEQSTPPSESWLRGLVEPLLGALDRIHGVGLVHGNVRPGRIMVQPDGAPLLMDFGAAREAISALAPWLAARPEPEYRAPELLDARTRIDAGPAADLYALAAVLQFCITGEPPLAAARRREGQPAPRLADLLPGLRRRHPEAYYGEGFVAAIDRAMSLDPAARPQSVAEFREQLLRDPLPARPAAAAVPQSPAQPAAAMPQPPVQRQPEPVARIEAPREDDQLTFAALADTEVQPLQAPEIPEPSRPSPFQAAARAVQAAAGRPGPAREWSLEAFRTSEPPARSEAPARRAPPELRDEPAFAPGHEVHLYDVPLDAGRGQQEPRFAPVAAPPLQWNRESRRSPRMWPWALGGLLVGAVLTATLALGVRRIADDARLAWASLTSTLPIPEVSAPTPRSEPGAATGSARPPGETGTTVTEAVLPPIAAAASAAGGQGAPLPPLAPAPEPAAEPTAERAAAVANPASAAAAPPPTTTATTQAAAAPAPAPAAQPGGVAGRSTAAPAPARSSGSTTTAKAPTAPPPQPRARVQAAEPSPVERALAERPKPALVSPAAACAPRSNFSLYQCMKAKCQEDAYYTHPQCIRLRRTDEVS